jgi:hypothetical protein
MAVLGLLALLAGCDVPKDVNPVEIWRRVSGEADADRPAPPGLDRPRPNLGMVPPRPDRPPPEVRDAVTAALGLFLAWSGWRFLDITSGSVSAAIGYPIEILNVLAPLAGLLMALFALDRALRPGGAEPPAA